MFKGHELRLRGGGSGSWTFRQRQCASHHSRTKLRNRASETLRMVNAENLINFRPLDLRTRQRLAAMSEQDRPGLVVFMIVTEGHKNSSHEFFKARIKAMIGRQQDVYNWHFTFLGADQDAFDDAAQMGIYADGVAMNAACQMAGGYGFGGGKCWSIWVMASRVLRSRSSSLTSTTM